MRKASLAPARCRLIDLTRPPCLLACAEDARNARLRSSPVQPRDTARRATCKLSHGIASMARCVHCARCPADRPSPTTRKAAALRGASRPAAWCGEAQSPQATTSTTAPVERVSSGADAIKQALRGLFPQLGRVLTPCFPSGMVHKVKHVSCILRVAGALAIRKHACYTCSKHTV